MFSKIMPQICYSQHASNLQHKMDQRRLLGPALDLDQASLLEIGQGPPFGLPTHAIEGHHAVAQLDRAGAGPPSFVEQQKRHPVSLARSSIESINPRHWHLDELFL